MRRTERQHGGHELEPDGKGVLFFLFLPVIFLVLLFFAVACEDPDLERTTAAEDPAPAATDDRSEPRPLERVRLPDEETEPAPPPGPVTFENAAKAYHEGRHEDAVSLFEAYVRENPDDAWGHYMLGLSAWKHGDLERAAEALREASGIDPGHRKAHVNLARVLLDDGRVDEAREEASTALELEPEAADALRVSGLVAEEEGRTAEAAEAYRSAILADPQDAWAMNNLGLLHIRRGAFDEALPALARAVELRDDVPVFRNNLGVALERTESYAAAADAYHAADSLAEGYEKARASLLRVRELEEASESRTVDLAALAGEFTRTVDRWREERVAETPPDSSSGRDEDPRDEEQPDGSAEEDEVPSTSDREPQDDADPKPAEADTLGSSSGGPSNR